MVTAIILYCLLTEPCDLDHARIFQFKVASWDVCSSRQALAEVGLPGLFKHAGPLVRLDNREGHIDFRCLSAE